MGRRRLILLIGLLVPALAGSGQEMAGHVQFKVLPTLAGGADGLGVAAIPRVVAGGPVSAEVAARINARLERLDAVQVTQIKACRAAAGKAGEQFDWAQEVAVTMRGPGFVSYHLDQMWMCAAAPGIQVGDEGLAYEVATGRPVDWPALLPGAVKGLAAEDGSGQVLVRWAPLLAALRVGQSAACREDIREGVPEFSVWLDGDLGALRASMDGLRLSDSCGSTVTLGLGELKRLKVSALVVDALEAAVTDPSPLAAKRRAAARKGR